MSKRAIWVGVGVCVLLGAFVGSSSCLYKPVKLEPELYDIRFVPNQVCSGENLWYSYEAREDFDWAELRGRDGSVLERFTERAGSGFVGPVRAEWLPLLVHVRAEGETFVRDVHDVVLIDETTWVNYDSDREISAGRSLVRVGTIQEWDEASGQMVDVNLYEVYELFTGFVWEVPATDFSSRAHLMRIRNVGGRTMEFQQYWAGGPHVARLAPGEDMVFTPPNRPWSQLSATRDEPLRRLVGLQKGELTKPENDHYELTDLYTELLYPLALEVVCMEAPSIE